MSILRIVPLVFMMSFALASRAGGLAIRLIDSEERKPMANVRVDALRPAAFENARGSVDALPQIASAKSDEDGWARLESLGEGPVILAVRACGTCIQLSQVLSISPNATTILKEWEVSPPANVEVQVLTSDRLRGRLRVTGFDWKPLDQPRWPQHARLRTEVKEGEAAAARLASGRWQVTAIARLDDSFSVPLEPSEVVLLPGDNPLHQIVTKLSIYDGRVVRRDEPVAGMLNLIPVKKGKQVATKSDRHGRFTTPIETPGPYDVMFQDAETRAGLKLQVPIEFGDPEKEVLVELPGGRIEGRMTNAEGVPLTTAIALQAKRRGDRAQVFAYSGNDGNFTIDYLDSGTWDVSVADDAWRGESVKAEVPKDGTSSGLILTVQPAQPVPADAASPAPPAAPLPARPPSTPRGRE